MALKYNGKDYLAQVTLKDLGLYRGDLDGKWGPQSETAYLQWLDQTPKTTGITRTDWRGFVHPENWNRLETLVPDQAEPLLEHFSDYGAAYDLNPLFLLSISRHETAAWTSNVFRTKNNAMGISDVHGAIALPNYGESIRRAAYSLGREGGYYSNCITLKDVAGVYAPVGAANDPTKLNSYWPGLIAKYWAEYEKLLKAE